MICRDRSAPVKEINPSPSVDLDNIDTPILLAPNDVLRGKNLARKLHAYSYG